MREESSYYPRAVSRAGARGLMQLMPATARGEAAKLGRTDHSLVRLTADPAYNVTLGRSYLGGLLDAYLYCNNNKALQVNNGIADWTGMITGKLPDSLVQKMLVTEYGGMNDALVNTYAFTGNKK